MAVGDMVVMSHDVWHCSSPNFSSAHRRAYMPQYSAGPITHGAPMTSGQNPERLVAYAVPLSGVSEERAGSTSFTPPWINSTVDVRKLLEENWFFTKLKWFFMKLKKKTNQKTNYKKLMIYWNGCLRLRIYTPTIVPIEVVWQYLQTASVVPTII